jgi:SPP1 gp7 family putative phage head morphogenesis protein
MPAGTELRKALVKVVREQRGRALEAADEVAARLALAAPVKAVAMPEVEVEWDEIGWGADPVGPDEEVLPAVTPILKAYWDDAGERQAEELNKARVRAGLDEVEWRVADPVVARKVRKAALDLSAATNATTRLKLAEALRRTRRALAGGMEAGETARQLRDRVRAIFRDAETWRAERIARTEAIRAYNGAREEAARRSHVVAGLKWLAASNACPLCLDVAARAGSVRLGGLFARVDSTKEAYRDVPYPPLHPHCRCAVVSVLKPEYGGPAEVAWAAAPITPGEVEAA